MASTSSVLVFFFGFFEVFGSNLERCLVFLAAPILGAFSINRLVFASSTSDSLLVSTGFSCSIGSGVFGFAFFGCRTELSSSNASFLFLSNASISATLATVL
jgi:hypothetical protein